MDRLENYADERSNMGCIHCGKPPDTKDHVPARVFLDKPYPDYPPVAPACQLCNNDLSLDEEYLACFIECVVADSIDPNLIRRDKIRSALKHNQKLAARILASRTRGPNGIAWVPELERAKRVIVKSARGHVAYEHNEWRLHEPSHVALFPLIMLSPEQRSFFESAVEQGALAAWPEVGTRAMQRLLIFDTSAHVETWIVVQENRYRYYVHYDAESLIVRMVFGEYLGAEVIWEN